MAAAVMRRPTGCLPDARAHPQRCLDERVKDLPAARNGREPSASSTRWAVLSRRDLPAERTLRSCVTGSRFMRTHLYDTLATPPPASPTSHDGSQPPAPDSSPTVGAFVLPNRSCVRSTSSAAYGGSARSASGVCVADARFRPSRRSRYDTDPPALLPSRRRFDDSGAVLGERSETCFRLGTVHADVEHRAGAPPRWEAPHVALRFPRGPESPSQSHAEQREANGTGSPLARRGGSARTHMFSEDNRRSAHEHRRVSFVGRFRPYTDVVVDISALPGPLHPLLTKLLALFDVERRTAEKRNLHVIVSHSPTDTIVRGGGDASYLFGFRAALESESTSATEDLDSVLGTHRPRTTTRSPRRIFLLPSPNPQGTHLRVPRAALRPLRVTRTSSSRRVQPFEVTATHAVHPPLRPRAQAARRLQGPLSAFLEAGVEGSARGHDSVDNRR